MKTLLTIFTLVFTVMFSTVFPSPVRGEFLNDRQAWAEQGLAIKKAYAMGVVDGAWGSDPEGIGAEVFQCLIKMRITPQALVDLIDNGYRDTVRWGLPPNVILVSEIVGKLCSHLRK